MCDERVEGFLTTMFESILSYMERQKQYFTNFPFPGISYLKLMFKFIPYLFVTNINFEEPDQVNWRLTRSASISIQPHYAPGTAFSNDFFSSGEVSFGCPLGHCGEVL